MGRGRKLKPNAVKIAFHIILKELQRPAQDETFSVYLLAAITLVSRFCQKMRFVGPWLGKMQAVGSG